MRIPTYQDRVDPRIGQATNRHTNISEGGLSEGLNNLSRGVGQLNRFLLAKEKIDAEALARKRANELRQIHRFKSYDPATGFMTKQLGDANGATRGVMLEELAEERARLGADLSPIATKIYSELADSLDNTTADRTIRHEGAQSIAFAEQQYEASVEGHIADAAISLSDDEFFESGSRALADIRALGNLRGLPANVIEQQEEIALSDMYAGKTLEISREDPIAAWDFLHVNQSYFEPDQFRLSKENLDPSYYAEQARNVLAARPNATFSDLDKIDDPKLRKAVYDAKTFKLAIQERDREVERDALIREIYQTLETGTLEDITEDQWAAAGPETRNAITNSVLASKDSKTTEAYTDDHAYVEIAELRHNDLDAYLRLNIPDVYASRMSDDDIRAAMATQERYREADAESKAARKGNERTDLLIDPAYIAAALRNVENTWQARTGILKRDSQSDFRLYDTFEQTYVKSLQQFVIDNNRRPNHLEQSEIARNLLGTVGYGKTGPFNNREGFMFELGSRDADFVYSTIDRSDIPVTDWNKAEKRFEGQFGFIPSDSALAQYYEILRLNALGFDTHLIDYTDIPKRARQALTPVLDRNVDNKEFTKLYVRAVLSGLNVSDLGVEP